jgi:mono/diheme cytochrome c family protein
MLFENSHNPSDIHAGAVCCWWTPLKCLGKISKLMAVMIFVPVFLLSACGKQEINLKGAEDALAQRSVTAAQGVIDYPDDNPSVPDGKLAFEQMNCATCHADSGKGVSGKCTVDLTSKEYERKQKPVDQFEFLSYGRPGLDHPKVNDKLSRRQAWNLVFYVRSLGQTPLTDAEWGEIDPVFGSNCAVCHGKKGVGDGPLARNLEPQPANFKNFERFYDRSDDVLWDHVAHGIKWEGMPDFLGKQDKAKNVKFDSDYIWKLVQYVRRFHESIVPTIAANPEKSENKPSTK